MSWKSKYGEVESLQCWEIGYKSALSNEWISADEMLPSKAGEYLCFVKGHGIRIRRYASWISGSRMRWWSNGSETKKVTHWMPLPELPHKSST